MTTTNHPDKPDSFRSRLQWYKWGLAAALVIIAATALYLLLPDLTVPSARELVRTRMYVPLQRPVQLMMAGNVTCSLTGDSAIHTKQIGDITLYNTTNGIAYTGTSRSSYMNTLLVPAAQSYRITLPDSSVIWLNAASRIRFPFTFSGNKREVYMEGEAYYRIMRNDRQPFIIHTPNTTVEVTGASFNINAYDAEWVRVSDIEGAVRVTGTTDTAVTLKPGMEAIYGDYSGIRTDSFKAEGTASWLKSKTTFSQRRLRDVKPILQRWFGVQVILDEPELGNYQVSGPLEKGGLMAFLSHLEATTPLRYYFVDNELHLHMKQ
ncbi:FecR family protein [Chitinophaga solisilvae]|uniref:FecR family protein n=1 Tax=Chitinophaga solisilvae TaxID=1233460 RepID=UPI00136BAB08|nr:FecR domain-containing protein [Chitinophaga solisilvae]